MKDRQNHRRYLIGIFASVSFFVAINVLHYFRPVTCDDCYFPYGLPYTIYHEGGFAGGAGFVYTGIAADLFLMVATGIGIGWAWKIFSKLYPGKM